jgi:hypothetical protein
MVRLSRAGRVTARRLSAVFLPLVRRGGEAVRDPKRTAAASDEGWRWIANHIKVALTFPDLGRKCVTLCC